MLTFGSLFAGIGGFDLGFERAEMRCLWQVEIDDYCTRVLEKHWPDVRRYRDVRECGRHNLEAVDVICGGFPCQPHSVAGKRRGAEDDRDLWPEYRRIIDELRPRWVVAENVPGIRTTILDAVLSDLDGLDYATRTLIIPACAFDAPHRRERVFIVGYASSWRCSLEGAEQERSISRQRAETSTGSDLQQNAPDPAPIRRNGRPHDQGQVQAERDRAEAGGDVADADNFTRQETNGQVGRMGRQLEQRNNKGLARGGANRSTESRLGRMADGLSVWLDEPDIPRVASGIPNRVDRLRALGNAVVPQVAEFIGRLIVETDGE